MPHGRRPAYGRKGNFSLRAGRSRMELSITLIIQRREGEEEVEILISPGYTKARVAKMGKREDEKLFILREEKKVEGGAGLSTIGCPTRETKKRKHLLNVQAHGAPAFLHHHEGNDRKEEKDGS